MTKKTIYKHKECRLPVIEPGGSAEFCNFLLGHPVFKIDWSLREKVGHWYIREISPHL